MRRATPRAHAAMLEAIGERAEWVAAEYEAGRLSLEDAEGLARDLRVLLVLEVARDEARPVGRPRGSSKARGRQGGMLAPYMLKVETRGRKRVWPDGFERVTFEAVTRYMERDGLTVSAAVKALMAHTVRALGWRESRAAKDVQNIRALYYQGRALAMKAQEEAKRGGSD